MAEPYTSPPAGLPPGSRVWAYLRDSGGPAQDRSVEQQEHEIRAYCERHHLVLDPMQIFRDVARSGGSTLGRDAFIAMMDMSEDESIRPAGLLIWNFARFARDYNDSVYYKATLSKRGIVVHSMTDQIPDDDFAGRIVETVINLANEEKRRQTSRDVKRGLRALVEKGFSPGVPPRGYIAVQVPDGERRDGKPRWVSKWEPDPDLAEYVRIAWKMRATGKSYLEISEATHGEVYSNSNSWSGFFKNKAYLGYGICGDLKMPDHHEPLTTPEAWEAVQRLREAHPNFGKVGSLNHPRRIGNPTILTGFTYCIECGAMMTHSTGSKRQRWLNYLCGNKDRRRMSVCPSRRVGAVRAESQIMADITAHVLTPEFIEETMVEAKKKYNSVADIELQLKAAEHKLEDLNIAIQRIWATIEKIRSSQSAQERLKLREAERSQVIVEIERLKLQLTSAKVEITPESMQVILQIWRDQLAKAQAAGDVREIKAWIMQFVSRIELGYLRAKIYYTYPTINFSDISRNVRPQFGGTGTYSLEVFS